MIKKIAAVLAGIISAGFAVFLVQAIGQYFYPLPEGTDSADIEALKLYVQYAPFMALFFVIISYFFGALVSGFVSTKVANDGKLVYAAICAVFFLMASIYNMFMLPTPIWFWILGILVWGFVFVGYQLAKKKKI